MEIEKLKGREVFPGFYGRFIHGDHSTLAFWEIKKGSVVKEHHHVHEQITCIIEGEFEMKIGGEQFMLKAGMVHVIPSNTPHSGIAITDCKIIDSFAPVREDYRV